jgi:glycosyltransferase involved in cell wall biosynthesis
MESPACPAVGVKTSIAHVKIVLATAFPTDPERPHGGVEAVSVVLAKALSNYSDFDVHVVTADPGCCRLAQSIVNGATVHRLPWKARRTLVGAEGRDGRAVRRYIADELRPDIVHAHDVYGLMLRGLALPRLLTIHGFIHADTLLADQRWRRVRARLWRTAEHATWADFPRIVSISPYVRERLSGIATGIIHDIDNPVAERFFTVSPEDRGARIFTAASVCPRKNTLGLVEAFALLRARGCTATLRIAGPQTQLAYVERVHARISALNLTQHVTLLPPLGADGIGQELATATVAALVSLEENSPLMIEEAMAAAVPVVTSNRCGMPYMVGDGETGFLVDPHDPAEIADRLGQLLESPSLRHAFGQRARRVAQERFHPAVVARRTREVYERAVALPHHASR